MDHAAKLAVGIDLGTTFSVLARLEGTGSPRVIPNLDGDLSTPSIVYFHEGGVVVGKEAAKLARHEPDAVAQFAKRDMGKALYHKAILGNRLPPELIQALILHRLKQDAAVTLGPFEKVVITVPAYFNEPRRKATMDAGRLAGLEVVDIINEPTAAALAYGVRDGFLEAGGRAARREQILVYDLGGGTFDATLMEIDGLKHRAVATDGDVCLGGIDWDQRIAEYVAQQFKAQFKVDLHQDPAAWQSLLQEAEDAKRALSNRPKVVVHFQHDGHRAAIPLTSELLESMTSDLVDRTMFTVKSLLRESGRQWRDLTRILLVGGSSRMPMVQAALEKESGLALDRIAVGRGTGGHGGRDLRRAAPGSRGQAAAGNRGPEHQFASPGRAGRRSPDQGPPPQSADPRGIRPCRPPAAASFRPFGPISATWPSTSLKAATTAVRIPRGSGAASYRGCRRACRPARGSR